MNEPHSSGNTDDIYEDIDPFSAKAACDIESKQEDSFDASDITKTCNITTSVPSQSSSTSKFSLNEDQLKKEEMILYLDLVVNHIDEKKALSNLKTEYMNLKKETDALRKSVCEKDEKISQLTAEVDTLKKNICSLYKTAKSEIEQKDVLLEEANKTIDERLLHGGRSAFQNKRYPPDSSQYQPSTSRMSNVPNQDFKQYEDHHGSRGGQNYQNKSKRHYETSDSGNLAFTRPSSFNPSENRSKWNRVNSKHRFPHHDTEKHRHSPSYDAVIEKCNTYNYKDRRNNYNQPKNNRINHNNERSPKKQKRCS